MSNKTELQANNVELQEILDSVNALPDAGSGGGSVETCTVTIELSTYVGYTTYSDSSGIYSICDTNSTKYGRSILVVKGGLIFAPVGSYYAFDLSEGVTILEQRSNTTIFSVASDIADTATICGYYND